MHFFYSHGGTSFSSDSLAVSTIYPKRIETNTFNLKIHVKSCESKV